MGFWDFLFGTPEKMEQIQKYTPEQQAAMNRFLNMGSTGIGNVANELGTMPQLNFDPYEKQAMSQFNQQVVPGIAERFTGWAGGQGGQRSSAFGQQLGAAGAGLAENLAAMKAAMAERQYGQNLNRLGMLGSLYGNLNNMGMQPQFDVLKRAGSPGLINNILSAGATFGVPYGLHALFGQGGNGNTMNMGGSSSMPQMTPEQFINTPINVGANMRDFGDRYSFGSGRI